MKNKLTILILSLFVALMTGFVFTDKSFADPCPVAVHCCCHQCTNCKDCCAKCKDCSCCKDCCEKAKQDCADCKQKAPEYIHQPTVQEPAKP